MMRSYDDDQTEFKVFTSHPNQKEQMEILRVEDALAEYPFTIRVKNRWSKEDKKIFSGYHGFNSKVRYTHAAPRSR